uniref:Uncharacterized protein n=1 Tax=candidate division WOR-3 bacterium TaxID=2052148 RepID=A0A7C4C9X1_UNCW3
MKALFWSAVLVLVLLAGYLIRGFVLERRRQAAPVSFEVSAESIAVYQSRIEEMLSRIARIRTRLPLAQPGERVGYTRLIAELEEEIRDLRVAVEQWRSARGAKPTADLYQKCILLYGRASGVCDAIAAETLPPGR